MTMSTKLQDAKRLDQYMVALNNAETKPGIIEAMAELGYNAESLNEGKAILSDARQTFEVCQAKKDILRASGDDFKEKKEKLSVAYEAHRNKAKLVYLNNRLRTEQLAISGQVPRIYPKWIEGVRKFYQTTLADQSIQEDLSKVNLSIDEINASMAMIAEMEISRADFMHAKGVSQSAYQRKDESLQRLHQWMKAFYYAAKIGLNGDPQLLESLGKIVRR